MEAEKHEIKLMPKIELHVHIEGATSPQTYFSLAEKNQVKLPCNNLSDWKKYFDFKDFNHFIDVYVMAVSTIKKAEDLALIVENFYEFQEQNNIIYSEAFLSASFLVETFSNQEILEAIQFGIQQGQKKYNTKINLIPDIARHLPETQSKVLELAIEGYNKGIFIGLGLGGMEINYPANLFTNTFAKAKKVGLRVVAHAGEAVGSESIWGAINDLNVERIGHGIRSIDDKNLIKYLRDTQIPIEVSPTSNYYLGVVSRSERHPIREMIDNGLNCSINTDDPAMFSTNISAEFELLYSQGFSLKELYQLNKNAIDSSFINFDEKLKYKKILDEYKTTYKNVYKKQTGSQ
ncbi:MAG: adenosine deaminase [Ignavibacteriae bacterium]|nr:adenosine deaminase [Ignavibacteriota bacterium]